MDSTRQHEIVNERGGHEWRNIVIYIVLTLILAALLAPWLYHLGKTVHRQGWLDTGVTGYIHGALDRASFARYFNRAVMIVALLGLIPLIRSLRFRGWRDLRIHKNPCAGMDLLAGFLLGAGFLLFMGAAFLYMDLFMPEAEPEWGDAPKFMASAIAVGIIEEVFFRGAILGVCLRRLRMVSAVLITSIIYAVVHFIKAPKKPEILEADVHWHTGFEMLGRALSMFGQWNLFIAEFLTLLMIGIVLAVVRLRTRSLWLPIGLHAGWVLGYKLFNEVTDKNAALLREWSPWVGLDLKTGLIPLTVVIITGAFASLWIDLSRKPVQPSSVNVSPPSS